MTGPGAESCGHETVEIYADLLLPGWKQARCSMCGAHGRWQPSEQQARLALKLGLLTRRRRRTPARKGAKRWQNR